MGIRRLLVWAVCAATLVVLALAFWLRMLNGSGPVAHHMTASNLVFVFSLSVSMVISAFIVARRPGNRIGLVLGFYSLLAIVFTFNYEYATYALLTAPGRLPGGEVCAWLAAWLAVPAWAMGMAQLCLLFPDGQLPSRRWRFVPWLTLTGALALAVSWAFTPGEIRMLPGLTNPLGIEALQGPLRVLDAVGVVLVPAGILISALALISRFREARGEEREQIKWFLYAGAITGLALSYGIVGQALLDLEPEEAFAPTIVVVVSIPAAVAIAIFKYRLYDIDVIINRTLVYGLLSGSLLAVYAGSVVTLQQLLEPLVSGSDLAIVVSTLMVAGLFQPARRYFQAAVDRRFYRRKYDAERTIASFSQLARNEVDLDQLCRSLTQVVAETVQPAHVSLWLREQ